MEVKYQILRDRPVSQKEIESLRLAVGWDKMEGKYQQILKNVYTYYTVHVKDELVGFISVLSDGVADALLFDLMVHPDHRKKGVGSELVKTAVRDLKSEEIKFIQTVFCKKDEPFFEKIGFDILCAGIIDNDVMDIDL